MNPVQILVKMLIWKDHKADLELDSSDTGKHNRGQGSCTDHGPLGRGGGPLASLGHSFSELPESIVLNTVAIRGPVVTLSEDVLDSEPCFWLHPTMASSSSLA